MQIEVRSMRDGAELILSATVGGVAYVSIRPATEAGLADALAELSQRVANGEGFVAPSPDIEALVR